VIDEVLIYDATGRIVRQLFSPESTQEIKLDISDLPPGIYLATVRTENDLTLKKFIKQ
jgi:hypothetical protein